MLRMRILCSSFWALFGALLQAAQQPEDLAERVARFKRAFAADADVPTQRSAALRELDGLDDQAVAAALVEAWKTCARESEGLLEQRTKLEAQIAGLIEGQEFKARTLPAVTFDAVEELKVRVRELLDRETALGELTLDLEVALRAQRSPAGQGWLLTQALTEDGLPFALRLAQARNAGGLGPAATAPLGAALQRTREPEDIVIVLTALGACGKEAGSMAAKASSFLNHADPGIRELAARTLARLAAPAGIEPLVKRLGQERGRTRRRLAIALEELTARNLGESPQAWKSWFAKEGAGYGAGSFELGLGRSRLAEIDADPERAQGGGQYVPFDSLPRDGHAIVYVIDCSGSMVVSIDDPKHKENEFVDAGANSRMAATRSALIEALGQLAPSDRFGIVCFNDAVGAFAPTMHEARPSEVKRAQAWVSAVQAANATNIHGALEAAFRMAGRGASDRYYESRVDTILLLTDGTPTLNNGEPDSTERIHAALEAWNPLRRVVIHTIGIGREVNRGFLRRIATDHGGRCVGR
jgi:Mg-chelatase subunit ChlD